MNHDSPSFSVTTYNVLANAYVSTERYANCDASSLDPQLRLTRLVREIAELESDIFCLQEVERPVFDALEKQLAARYRGQLSIKQGRPEGCALFVSQRFEVESFETVRFRSNAGSGDQLALVAILKDSTYRFGVASTHLQWMKAGTATEEHTGVDQLCELVARTSAEHAIPWILAGDFNAEVDSPVLETARVAGFELSCRKQEPSATTNLNGRLRKIDYLLVSCDDFVSEPLALSSLQANEPMPSSRFPSDHLPLSVKLSLVQEGERG